MTTYGYLERPYLSDPYLTGFQTSPYGMQVLLVVNQTTAKGVQTKAVVNTQTARGVQTKAVVQTSTASGTQVKGIVTTAKPLGVQTKAVVQTGKVIGIQTKAIARGTSATSTQVKAVAQGSKSVGVQVKGIVQTAKALGLQIKAIAQGAKPVGIQVNGVAKGVKALGVQVSAVAQGAKALGVQVKGVVQSALAKALQVKAIAASGAAVGVQTTGVVSKLRSLALQVRAVTTSGKTTAVSVGHSNFAYWDSHGYLVRPYLTDPYLAEWFKAQGGMQVLLVVNAKKQLGMQLLVGVNAKTAKALQAKAVVNKTVSLGMQVLARINAKPAKGVQVRGVIKAVNAYAFQVSTYIRGYKNVGMQVAPVEGLVLGVQATLVIYNTTNLRVLATFPSRGNGTNWTASSTQAGDFSVNNLNTDIVEQQWRSAPGQIISQTLDCDTGVSQVYIDTFAMMNHNLTSSAVVTLQGSNTADQSVVGISINIPVTKRNIIWVAPMLPMAGYRYWRISINDPTNTVDNQLKIGTIVFGSSKIFQGENITDAVKLTKIHFVDKVETEGFTDVMNDRSLKRAVEVSFKDLKYGGGNYQGLEDIFDTARTSLKCLWIPDPKVPTRFGVFAKLAELPEESHNNLGVEADYVDFSVKLDESL